MDSQQLVDTASQNSQDIVLPKPASSTPRHSIDAILGLANNKRTHQEMEDSARDTQENTGVVPEQAGKMAQTGENGGRETRAQRVPSRYQYEKRGGTGSGPARGPLAHPSGTFERASRIPGCTTLRISQLSDVPETTAVAAKRRRCWKRRAWDPNGRDDQHRERRARGNGTTESSWPRPTHDQHPGVENAGQGARREHHQRVADGLKFNVQPRKARRSVLRPHGSRRPDAAGVTRSETTLPSTLRHRRNCPVTDRIGEQVPPWPPCPKVEPLELIVSIPAGRLSDIQPHWKRTKKVQGPRRGRDDYRERSFPNGNRNRLSCPVITRPIGKSNSLHRSRSGSVAETGIRPSRSCYRAPTSHCAGKRRNPDRKLISNMVLQLSEHVAIRSTDICT
ncbi:uncharacterized protein LOC143208655 isoform X1 [Lasioglossum baleicum]|uniref:uncharacterized protein LOC143208655 isoform X1 n=1 Tax=Lasioglossum baleicum TaxID=434251 RepID=UPI003FCCEFC2